MLLFPIIDMSELLEISFLIPEKVISTFGNLDLSYNLGQQELRIWPFTSCTGKFSKITLLENGMGILLIPIKKQISG